MKEKIFTISVRFFVVNFSNVMTNFFDMNFRKGRDASVAETMFDSVNNQFAKQGINRGSDCQHEHNIGAHNSIASRVKGKIRIVL